MSAPALWSSRFSSRAATAEAVTEARAWPPFRVVAVMRGGARGFLRISAGAPSGAR